MTLVQSFSFLLLLTHLALAREKSDTVTLVNGNEVTCEIKRLDRGVLAAKTDSLSNVSIRWEDVTGVKSTFVYEIVLSDRSTHFGPLASDHSGNLLLAGSDPTPLRNVVALHPVGARIASRFDGALDFGYSFMQSHTTTQLNFDGDLRYTTRQREVQAKVANNLVVRDQTAATRRLQADLNFTETLSRGYFALAIGQFSLNDELNLMQRYLGGGAFGRYLVRTNRSLFATYGGSAYSSEHYAGAQRRNNAEVLIGLNTQIFRLYSPKVDITGDVKLWPNLTTSGRFRLDLNAKARIEVYKNLFVSFSFFDNYDRKNPTTALPMNDFGVVTSIGYSFNR